MSEQVVTRWPICTRHPAEKGWRNSEHVGNEAYGNGSPAWAYVDQWGDATCSCCDPVNGFPCTAPVQESSEESA